MKKRKKKQEECIIKDGEIIGMNHQETEHGPVPDYEDSGGDIVECKEVRRGIGMSGIVERCRRSVVYEGLDFGEAARKFKVTVQTVKNWAKNGQWEMERLVVTSGQAEKIEKSMEEFAMSRELPLVHGYYELQEKALKRLVDVVDDEKCKPETVRVILEIAEKGLNLGERVLGRSNPSRAKRLMESYVGGGNVNVPGGSGVQVNVLAAAQQAQKVGDK
jgi:hypothetical protein